MQSNKDFKFILKRYNSKIYGIINKFSNSAIESDDIAQNVYIKSWQNIHKLKTKDALWAWMRTITVNTCKDHLKKNKKHKDQILENDNALHNIKDSSISIDEKIQTKERQKFIFSKINKLKPKLKEVIILYDIKELSCEDISQKLNCPVGTVKSRLFNARKALKEELSELI